MHKVTALELTRASFPDLKIHLKELKRDRKRLDRFFAIYFASMTLAEMRDDKPGTVEWTLYRKMKEVYDRTDSLIRSANYYLGEHSRLASVQKLRRVQPTYRDAGLREENHAHGSNH